MKTNPQYTKFVSKSVILLLFIFTNFAHIIPHINSVVTVLLTLTSIVWYFQYKPKYHLSMLHKSILVTFAFYFGVYLVSFTINAFIGNLEEPKLKYIEHEVRMLFFIPIFLLFYKLTLSDKIFWYATNFAAITSGIYALIYKLWLFPDPIFRVKGAYNAIIFGDISILLSFLCLSSFSLFRKKNKCYLILILTSFILGLIATFLSGTRGAWITIPIFTIILFLQMANHLKLHVRLLILGFIFLFFFITYKLPYFQIKKRLVEVVNDVTAYYDGNKKIFGSSMERIECWQAALDIIKEHPIIGTGPGSYQPIVHKMIKQGKRHPIISRYNQPHNIFLDAMVNCGTFGLIAILSIFICPFVVLLHQIKTQAIKRDLGYAGIMLVVGFLHFGLTETIFARNVYISYYIIYIAFLLTAAPQLGCNSKSLVEGSRQD